MDKYKPIRILQVFGRMDCGGAENFIVNVYRNIDRSAVQFDFIVHTEEHCFFDDEIKALGGRIFAAPRYNGINHLSYSKWWEDFFRSRKEYGVIHAHMTSTATIYLKIAKKYKLTTIAHSHSTSNGKGIAALVKDFLECGVKYTADYLFACSKEAGEWLYGNKVMNPNFHVINNGIEIKKYIFDENIRNEYRKKLGLGDCRVFGHVGRFHVAKNHKFLLEVFTKVHKHDPKTKLLLIGDGPLKNEIVETAEKQGMKNCVIFLGVRDDVANILQAMDCFLFPSSWEGFGIVVIEAQASGLPCFVSDRIPLSTKVSELVHFLPVDKGSEMWKREIENSKLDRETNIDVLREAGYDIVSTTRWLEKFYKEI